MTDDGDRLLISGLALFTHCGVTPEERTVGQRVLVDVELTVRVGTAARRGGVEATVDYAALCQSIHDAGAAARHSLLEALAMDLADVVLAHPRVRDVRIRVTKPRPPIAPDVGSFSVEIVRVQAGHRGD